MERPANILVVDDDPAITSLVVDVLESAGMNVCACNSGQEALALFEQRPLDLMIVDVMMPGMSGFDLCAQIRRSSRIPLVFLSARGEESDKVVGLTLGGDDYITKPFQPRELIARVNARLRWLDDPLPAREEGRLAARGVVVDEDTHTARFQGQELRLTPKEFDVLVLLLHDVGKPVSARDIYERVWGETFLASSGNSVTVHIRHLREKLAAIDSSEEVIQTVWGVGYRIVAQDAEDARG